MRRRVGVLSILTWLAFLLITLSLAPSAEAVTGHNLSGENTGVDSFGQPYWEVGEYRYTRGPVSYSCELQPEPHCFYQESPAGPDYWIDDWDDNISYGTNNTLFRIKWNDEAIYWGVPISNVDSRDRPYWEKDGYRYTRGPLKADFPNNQEHWYYVCRTPAGVMPPFTPPTSITVPAASTTGWRLVNNVWIEGYIVSWGHSISSINGVTYHLEEATDSNFTTDLRTITTTSTSTVITDRSPDVTYYYRVRAQKGEEYSAWVTAENGCTISAGGDGWFDWWSGDYTDYLDRSDFPTKRPVIVRVHPRVGNSWQICAGGSYYHEEGEYFDWGITIDGNSFSLYDTGYNSMFNLIDLKLVESCE